MPVRERGGEPIVDLAHHERPMLRVLCRRSRGELKQDGVVGRGVNGPKNAFPTAAFDAVVQLVFAVKKRPRAAVQQHGRLVAAQHIDASQPIDERLGIGGVDRSDSLLVGGSQLLALLGGQQPAGDHGLPEFGHGQGHARNALN